MCLVVNCLAIDMCGGKRGAALRVLPRRPAFQTRLARANPGWLLGFEVVAAVVGWKNRMKLSFFTSMWVTLHMTRTDDIVQPQFVERCVEHMTSCFDMQWNSCPSSFVNSMSW